MADYLRGKLAKLACSGARGSCLTPPASLSDCDLSTVVQRPLSVLPVLRIVTPMYVSPHKRFVGSEGQTENVR